MNKKARTLSELNLIDNFLFTSLMGHEKYGPMAAKIILEIILGREVNIRSVHAEKVILPSNPALHGIRMDAMIEEERTEVSQGEAFDVEPDNKKRDKRLLPQRARYYHSRMDGKLLESSTSYSGLPGTWVIFITSFDPFEEDRMMYTIKSCCVELPEMKYEDGATTLFLYVNGTKGCPPKELQELLKFMVDTTSGNAKSQKLSQIQSFVENLKMNPYLKEAYMTWDEYIQYEREEAAEEAAEKAAKETAKEAALRAEAERKAAEAEHKAAEADRMATEYEKEITILKKKLADLGAMDYE